MKIKTTLILFFLIFSNSLFSNSCTSTAGVFASWAALTWTCVSAPTSGPPGCGDVINIGAGTTVQISADVDYSACPSPIVLNIYGTMDFNTNGVRFKLPPGSVVVVEAGGKITKSFPGGGSSALISVGGVDVWTAGMGTITGPIVLPVELLSFTATAESKSVILNWSSASETNNDYYTVEKSKDGSVFEFVARVEGAGNSISVLNYTTEDKYPTEGVTYYRLKQTDFNGHSMYFDMVPVDYHNNSDFSFNFFPNPTNGSALNFRINSEKGVEISVVIYDITGREVYSNVLITEDKGDNIFKFDFQEKLTSGVYIVKATSFQNSSSNKLVIQ